MLKNEILVLSEKTNKEQTFIIHAFKRLLQIYPMLLDEISKVHLICSYDTKQIDEIEIPSNLVFHKLGVWKERQGIIRLFFHVLYLLRSTMYSGNLLKKNRKISVIMNLMNHETQGLIGILLSKLYRRKIIIRISNDVEATIILFEKKYGKFLGKIYKLIIYPIEKIILDKADVIISVSPIILEKYPQHRSKLFVIPGLSSALERYRHKKFKEKISGEVFRLLFVGRLEPEKGVDLLLEALVGMKDVKCSIVGDGSLKGWLKEKTVEFQLQDIVNFHGFLQQNLVFSLMEQSDALVLPSYSEYTPNVVIEAFAIGLPVIASKVGGIKYLLNDGETGVLFTKGVSRELKQKILLLKEDSVLREKITKKAREYVYGRYNPDEIRTLSKKMLQKIKYKV